MHRRDLILAVYLPTALLATAQGFLLATLPVYAYQIGWQRYDLGRMAAISVVMMAILCALLFAYMVVLKRTRTPQ